MLLFKHYTTLNKANWHAHGIKNEISQKQSIQEVLTGREADIT